MIHQEALNKIKYISSNLCNKFNEFDKSLEEITTLPSSGDDNVKENVCLRDLFNNLNVNSRAAINKSHTSLKLHLEALEKKQQEVNGLRNELTKRKREQKAVDDVKRKTETFENKLKELQNLKDCIKTWKLLTGTNFAYNNYKTHTTGYIKGDSYNYEIIDFNNSQMSLEEITKNLWSMLEAVSRENCQNKFEYKLSSNKKLILSQSQ